MSSQMSIFWWYRGYYFVVWENTPNGALQEIWRQGGIWYAMTVNETQWLSTIWKEYSFPQICRRIFRAALHVSTVPHAHRLETSWILPTPRHSRSRFFIFILLYSAIMFFSDSSPNLSRHLLFLYCPRNINPKNRESW